MDKGKDLKWSKVSLTFIVRHESIEIPAIQDLFISESVHEACNILLSCIFVPGRLKVQELPKETKPSSLNRMRATGMTGKRIYKSLQYNSIRVLALFMSQLAAWHVFFTSSHLLFSWQTVVPPVVLAPRGAGDCIAILPRRCRPSFRARFGCRPRSLFLAEHTPIFWAQSWNCFGCMLKMSYDLVLVIKPVCAPLPSQPSELDFEMKCLFVDILATLPTCPKNDTITLVPYLMQFLRAWSGEAQNSQASVKAHRSTMDLGLFRLVNS